MVSLESFGLSVPGAWESAWGLDCELLLLRIPGGFTVGGLVVEIAVEDSSFSLLECTESIASWELQVVELCKLERERESTVLNRS